MAERGPFLRSSDYTRVCGAWVSPRKRCQRAPENDAIGGRCQEHSKSLALPFGEAAKDEAEERAAMRAEGKR